jgi:four helix bundle protein
VEALKKILVFVRPIQRPWISFISNIAENFYRVSRVEFHQCLVIAKDSCAEARSQLYVANDAGYIPNEGFDKLKKLAEEESQVWGVSFAVQKQKGEQK